MLDSLLFFIIFDAKIELEQSICNDYKFEYLNNDNSIYTQILISLYSKYKSENILLYFWLKDSIPRYIYQNKKDQYLIDYNINAFE